MVYFYVSNSNKSIMCMKTAHRMDEDRAAGFAEDLLDKEKLKDLTAADGTLPGG